MTLLMNYSWFIDCNICLWCRDFDDNGALYSLLQLSELVQQHREDFHKLFHVCGVVPDAKYVYWEGLALSARYV